LTKRKKNLAWGQVPGGKTGTLVPEFPILKWAAAREDRMFARAMDYGRILGFDAWALSMLLGGFAVAGSLLLLLM
jgi:hypothetical protein